MPRCIIKFKNDEYLNIPAEWIDVRDAWVMAWDGEALVAVAKAEDVICCYISEKKGD